MGPLLYSFLLSSSFFIFLIAHILALWLLSSFPMWDRNFPGSFIRAVVWYRLWQGEIGLCYLQNGVHIHINRLNYFTKILSDSIWPMTSNWFILYTIHVSNAFHLHCFIVASNALRYLGLGDPHSLQGQRSKQSFSLCLGALIPLFLHLPLSHCLRQILAI